MISFIKISFIKSEYILTTNIFNFRIFFFSIIFLSLESGKSISTQLRHKLARLQDSWPTQAKSAFPTCPSLITGPPKSFVKKLNSWAQLWTSWIWFLGELQRNLNFHKFLKQFWTVLIFENYRIGGHLDLKNIKIENIYITYVFHVSG